MEVKWTYAMVKDELAARDKSLRAGEFTEAILIVTPDSSIFIDGAVHDRIGPFYLVWCEHHPNFIEHEDEVLLFRSYSAGRKKVTG